MPNINIRKLTYILRTRLLRLNNIVIAVAFVIAASWVWGALGMMQRNYNLQKEVDTKKRQLQLVELQKDTLELQKRYYQTNEYKELAARESLGLVRPGESVLVLPANSAAATATDQKADSAAILAPPTSNLEQWVNFLFGGYSRSIDGE